MSVVVSDERITRLLREMELEADERCAQALPTELAITVLVGAAVAASVRAMVAFDGCLVSRRAPLCSCSAWFSW